MRRGNALRASAALALGALHAASFAPLGSWWLQSLVLAAAVLLVFSAPPSATARQQAWTGWAFGVGWFAAGVSWLFVSMHRYGGMPAPMAAAAVLLFSAYLAVFASAAFALAWRIGGRHASLHAGEPGAGVALAFAGLWGLGEMARGWLFTGFPWLATGYAHVDGPLAHAAPVVGVYGVSALGALASFGLALLAFGAWRRRLSVAGLALLAAPVLAALALSPLRWSAPAGEPLRARLLQGNVPQDLKFDPQRSLRAMAAYAEEIERSPAHLTMLPETAWTVPWSATPPWLADRIAAHLARSGGVAAIGMPLPPQGSSPGAAPRPRYANSMAVIDASGRVAARYDKRHLVPFGEFVPFGFGWFVRMMHIPLGEFARGTDAEPTLELRGQRVAFNICYEDLFGEELAQQVRAGATVLANASNIAWFGDSHALPQHLQIARMRSRELARPMLRATNTGVTAAIDERGAVVAQMAPHATGAIEVELRGATGLTPYARFGNLLPLALALALLAAGLALSARRR